MFKIMDELDDLFQKNKESFDQISSDKIRRPCNDDTAQRINGVSENNPTKVVDHTRIATTRHHESTYMDRWGECGVEGRMWR